MKKSILSFLLIAFIFFFVGFFSNLFITPKTGTISITRFSKDRLTNPLLDCEIYNSDSNTLANTLKRQVNDLLNSYTNRVDEVSVYYRDLNNGPAFGINENEEFAPSSLLKVPLMITYLKKAETDPSILSQKVNFSGQHYLSENLPQQASLTQGENYTIDNLLYRMITLSDNLAFEVLLNNIDSKDIQNVHKDLDIIYPSDQTPEDYINVKSYAGLFRVLYNATYLNRSMSEKALTYLTKSDFHLGIQAGIPKNIVSALKFGIRDINDQGTLQIHDCGVVYEPENPYLLCVMTRGNNRDNSIQLIKEISKTVYDNVHDK